MMFCRSESQTWAWLQNIRLTAWGLKQVCKQTKVTIRASVWYALPPWHIWKCAPEFHGQKQTPWLKNKWNIWAVCEVTFWKKWNPLEPSGDPPIPIHGPHGDLEAPQAKKSPLRQNSLKYGRATDHVSAPRKSEGCDIWINIYWEVWKK